MGLEDDIYLDTVGDAIRLEASRFSALKQRTRSAQSVSVLHSNLPQ